MTTIRLIRNGWFLGAVGMLYCAGLWLAFQWSHPYEIELAGLARSVEAPDASRALRVYHGLNGGRIGRTNRETFATLAGVLERAGRPEEAIDVWRRVVAAAPQEAALRARLALALHSGGQYDEAEIHFATLLREGGG